MFCFGLIGTMVCMVLMVGFISQGKVVDSVPHPLFGIICFLSG